MRLRIPVYLIIVLMLYGCVHQGKSGKNEQFQSDTIVKAIEKSSPFAPIVEKGIEELIQYSEKEVWGPDSTIVYGLVFYKEENKEFLGMSTFPFYMKDRIIGYTYYNGHMIVYDGDTIIGGKYVDLDKLEIFNGTLPGCIDYHDKPRGIYEIYGILYQIISPDSLLMVHKGMI